MKKAGILALLLALALLLTGCGKEKGSDMDAKVIRVGNIAYTYGDLLGVEASNRSYYDQMNELYASYGLQGTTYTEEQIRNEAVNTLVWQAVVLDKANQMKLSELTDAEKAQVSANTTAAMAEYRAQMEPLMTFEEGATAAERRAAVDAALTESGITRADVYRVEWERYVIEKTRDWAVANVAVTEEEFDAAFDAQVASEMNNIEENLSNYGLQILNGGQPLYAPAGYREVEWLLINYDENDQKLISELDEKLYSAEEDAEEALDRVTDLLGKDADVDALVAQVTVTLNEVTDPMNITLAESVAAFETELTEEASAAVISLACARALENAYAEQMALMQDAANAAIAPEVEEALRRLENGEDWALVQEHYNDDTDLRFGTPVVCADFAYAPDAFVEAAMAIETPGQCSDAVYAQGEGCFIVRYVSDVAEGAVDRATVRDSIMEELLSSKQETSFSSTVNIWAEDASNRTIVNYALMGQ